MKILATKPVTFEDKVKMSIARHLDEAFISNKDGSHTLFTNYYKDFDVLVDKIAGSIMNQIGGDKELTEAKKKLSL